MFFSLLLNVTWVQVSLKCINQEVTSYQAFQRELVNQSHSSVEKQQHAHLHR